MQRHHKEILKQALHRICSLALASLGTPYIFSFLDPLPEPSKLEFSTHYRSPYRFLGPRCCGSSQPASPAQQTRQEPQFPCRRSADCREMGPQRECGPGRLLAHSDSSKPTSRTKCSADARNPSLSRGWGSVEEVGPLREPGHAERSTFLPSEELASQAAGLEGETGQSGPNVSHYKLINCRAGYRSASCGLA